MYLEVEKRLLLACVMAAVVHVECRNARLGGLGIPLIVKLSSALSYEALPSGGDAGFRPRNRTTVSVAVQSAAAEEDA